MSFFKKANTASGVVAATFLSLSISYPASSMTLQEAMSMAYDTNPRIEAGREGLEATKERKIQAKSGYLPKVSAYGDVGVQHRNNDLTGKERLKPASIGINLNQPVYRGGRTQAEVKTADALISSGEADLNFERQTVLLEVVSAYMNVVRDKAVLDLTTNNEQVLKRQLKAAKDRFEVGEITRTDVSQSESRLAKAVADKIEATGNVEASLAEFERVVGQPAVDILPAEVPKDIPQSKEEALEMARSKNPEIISASFNERANLYSIDTAKGEGRPEVGIVAEARRAYGVSSRYNRDDDVSIKAQVTIPLYTGGATESRIREAKYRAARSSDLTMEAIRKVDSDTIRAWEALKTTRAAIESIESQVTSAQIALEGVKEEAVVGSRAILDVLDAEQELLDAKVSLIRAQRDQVVAAYQLLAASGNLSSITIQK